MGPFCLRNLLREFEFAPVALQKSALVMIPESKSLFSLLRMVPQLTSSSFSNESGLTTSSRSALYAAISSSRLNSALRFLPEVGVGFAAGEENGRVFSFDLAAASACLSRMILSVNCRWSVLALDEGDVNPRSSWHLPPWEVEVQEVPPL